MNWKIKIFLLFILCIPGFTGGCGPIFEHEIVCGVSAGNVSYFIVSWLILPIILGSLGAFNILAVGSLIALPLVWTGAFVSYILFALFGGSSPFEYSPHYVNLGLRVMTVVPIAISIVACVPFYQIEQSLLQNKRFMRFQKMLLMFIRTFNHILSSVIPSILEVIREESWADILKPQKDAPDLIKLSFKDKISILIKQMTDIGIEAISASTQYIAVWAAEISSLPDKEKD